MGRHLGLNEGRHLGLHAVDSPIYLEHLVYHTASVMVLEEQGLTKIDVLDEAEVCQSVAFKGFQETKKTVPNGGSKWVKEGSISFSRFGSSLVPSLFCFGPVLFIWAHLEPK